MFMSYPCHVTVSMHHSQPLWISFSKVADYCYKRKCNCRKCMNHDMFLRVSNKQTRENNLIAKYKHQEEERHTTECAK